MKSFIYSISIIIKMESDILNITDIPLVDETIERYEFHEYEPTARTNLNTAGEIRINIELPRSIQSSFGIVFAIRRQTDEN